MHYLHMIRTDPAWYLQKLWWTGVLFGGILIVGTAFRNRRRNGKKAAREEQKVTIKPDRRSHDDNEYN